MTSTDREGILDKYFYSYNNSGLISGIDRDRRELENISGRYEYQYDAIGRLTRSSLNGELRASYEYDAFGNRTSLIEKDAQTTYTYDVLDRLVEAKELNNTQAIVRSYDYDKRGNQTSEYVDGLLNKTFTFDATNMLSKVVDTEKGELENQYNGLGFRVASTRPEERIEYLCDLSRDCFNLLERTVNGETESFIYDRNVVSMSKAGNSYYYLHDELGSPMYMTGTDGASVSSYAFDDFGRDIDPFTGKLKEVGQKHTKHAYTTEGNIIQPFAFTGYQEDEVSGLMFAQARHYDATRGRFQSEDRVKGFKNAPHTLNHYSYCFGNPVGFVDRNGNWFSLSDMISEYVHKIIANPYFVYATQNGMYSELFEAAGFVEDKENGQGTGVYHAKFDCWQSAFGYNDLYDLAFDLGTSMNRAKFEFSMQDENGNTKYYVLWGWKGDYLNLGAGGEFGIYESDNNSGFYDVNKDLALPMTLQIVDSNGNVIIDYNPDSPQWWITGFNSYYQNMNAGDLNMRFTVDFSSNPDLYEAFIHSSQYLEHTDMWSTDPNNKYILIFTWEGDICIG